MIKFLKDKWGIGWFLFAWVFVLWLISIHVGNQEIIFEHLRAIKADVGEYIIKIEDGVPTTIFRYKSKIRIYDIGEQHD